MRLIDADALLTELYGRVVENDKIHGRFIYSDLEPLIRDASIIDTERPCDNCQEWDCYGCDYKQTEREVE